MQVELRQQLGAARLRSARPYRGSPERITLDPSTPVVTTHPSSLHFQAGVFTITATSAAALRIRPPRQVGYKLRGTNPAFDLIAVSPSTVVTRSSVR